jgi:hypothetical protein
VEAGMAGTGTEAAAGMGAVAYSDVEVGVGVRIGGLTTITGLHRAMRWPTVCSVSDRMILVAERI